MRLISAKLGVIGLLAMPVSAYAATTVYNASAAFGAAISNAIVDDYENAAYVFQQSDADMSAVLGQTKYTSTGFSDNNLVFESLGNKSYCAGCNGSFLLDFSSTINSVGGTVFGVGFDFRNNVFGDGGYTAFVTFGDNSTADYLSTNGPDNEIGFFGVTSTLGVKSIYVGLSGASTTNGGAVIDNLTIGQAAVGVVPEPATWAMMIAGFGLVGGSLRRRKITANVSYA